MSDATWQQVDRVGAEVCYLHYQRGWFGSQTLIGAYSRASDALKVVTPGWANRDKERLYAVYENGNMREVTQTMELLSQVHSGGAV